MDAEAPTNIDASAGFCCNAYLSSEYEYDILCSLKEYETWRTQALICSTQIENRTSMVEFIRSIAEKHSYLRSTVHLAVHMLDLVISHHIINEKQLKLVALTCFYIACKVEENEPLVPSTGKLCDFVQHEYIPSDIKELEKFILNFFNWHVTIPTAATFLDFFTIHCLQMDDFIIPRECESGNVSFEDLKCQIIQSSLDYLDFSLMYYKMGNVKPSLLAAACVAAARCLTPNVRAWSTHLTRITGYNYQQIDGICSMLVFEVRPLSPSHSVSSQQHSRSESGYRSSSISDDESNSECSDSSSDDTSSTSTVTCSTCSTSSSSTNLSSSDLGESSAKKQKMSHDLT